MEVLLLATYELGRQPFGLASPAAWLRRAGFVVQAYDLSRQPLPEAAVQRAQLVAFYLPMHTATRLAAKLLPRVRALAPAAALCCYGLYAPLNADYLRALGAQHILGGEFEAELVTLARAHQANAAGLPPRSAPPPAAGPTRPAGAPASPSPSRVPAALPRLRFLPPDRAGLPPLSAYAKLITADGPRLAGYTEASRGCKHLCRHCPIVPVYGGHFRVVAPEVVLEDIRRQVAAGAQHITFGDPDFFNGPAHALRIVRALHAEFPALSYDVTIKVEHLLRHANDLPELRATGCALITTAVESLDDGVLQKLDKGHTRADFFRLVPLLRPLGLALNPTFVPFTPWTSVAGYAELLRSLAGLGLDAAVAPIQLGIRLLIPRGSLILELPDAAAWLGAFEEETLSYQWRHPDPAVDRLHRQAQALIAAGVRQGRSRRDLFATLQTLAEAAAGAEAQPAPIAFPAPESLPPRELIPYLDEPWFC